MRPNARAPPSSLVNALSWTRSPSSSRPEPTPGRRAAARRRPGRPRAAGRRRASATSSTKPAIRSRRALACRRAARARRAGSRPAASARACANASGRETAVEAEVVADREHGAALARLEREGVLELLEAVARAREGVAVRRRWGRRRDIRCCFSPISAQTSLCATPRASGCARELSALRRRRCACEMCVAAVEARRRARPAALLDAGDRDRQLRAGADEDGDVEDPVLLRADELLAVVEQHVVVERVDDRELRHRAGVGGLGDHEAARKRLVERDVGCDRVEAGKSGVTTIPRWSTGSPSWNGVAMDVMRVLLSGGSSRSPGDRGVVLSAPVPPR